MSTALTKRPDRSKAWRFWLGFVMSFGMVTLMRDCTDNPRRKYQHLNPDSINNGGAVGGDERTMLLTF